MKDFKVFIVEENEGYFLEILQTCQQEDIPCYPSNLDEFYKLRGFLVASLWKGNRQDIIVEADNYIGRVIVNFCIGADVLFLIDDELKDGMDAISGFDFYKKFKRFIELALFISSLVFPWKKEFHDQCTKLGCEVIWKDEENYPAFSSLLPKLLEIKETRITKVS